MTLALYGKTRKRQQALLFAAFMAIIIGALAGASFWRGDDADAAPLPIIQDELNDPALPGWSLTGNVTPTNGAVELSGDGSSMAYPLSTVGYSNLSLSVTCRGVVANEGGGDDHDILHVEFNANGGTGSWPGTGFATYLGSFGCPTSISNTVTVPLSPVYGVNNNPNVMIRVRSENHDGPDEKVIIESVKLEGDPSVVTMELFPGEFQSQVGWPIRFYNAGPATTVKLDVNYGPHTTTTNLAGTNGPVSNCDMTSNTSWVSCDVALNASTVNGGMTQVTFYTTAPVDTCEDVTVDMEVSGLLNGVAIPARAGTTLSDQYTHPATECDPTEPLFTIDKQDSTKTAGDGAYVEWEIWLHNGSGATEPVHVRDTGATLFESNCAGGDTATQQGDIIACLVAPGDAGGQPEATLTVWTPYHPTALEQCKGGTRTNYAELAQVVELTLSSNALSDTATATITPIMPAAHCITVAKTNIDESTWHITFTNTGAAADINFTERYEGAGGDITGISLGGAQLPCDYSTSEALAACVAHLPAGIQTSSVTTVVVTTEPVPATTCGETTVTNTVRAFLGSTQVYELAGSPSSATFTQTADCNSTVKLCKAWQLDAPGEVADPDPQSFQFGIRDQSVGKGDPDTIATIPNVREDEAPECVFLDVREGLVSFNEVGPAAGFVFDGWTWENGSTPQESPIEGDNRPLFLNVRQNYCEVPQPALTSSLLGVVRDVQQVVVLPGEPGEVACTVTFFNHDVEGRLPTGDLRIEKYKDVNGDGDANDAGEGLIEGSFEMKKVGDPITTLWDLPGGTRTFSGLTPGDDYQVEMDLPQGWKVTNATISGYSVGPAQDITAGIYAGSTQTVRFYLQPPATPTPAPTSTATPASTSTPTPASTSTPVPATTSTPPSTATPNGPAGPAPSATATPTASSTATPSPSQETPATPPGQGGAGPEAPVTVVAGEKTAGAEPTPVAPSTGSSAESSSRATGILLLAALFLATSGIAAALALALRKERRH